MLTKGNQLFKKKEIPLILNTYSMCQFKSKKKRNPKGNEYLSSISQRENEQLETQRNDDVIIR